MREMGLDSDMENGTVSTRSQSLISQRVFWGGAGSWSDLIFIFNFSFEIFVWLLQVLAVACEIQFPNQGSNPGPLPWGAPVLLPDHQGSP